MLKNPLAVMFIVVACVHMLPGGICEAKADPAESTSCVLVETPYGAIDVPLNQIIGISTVVDEGELVEVRSTWSLLRGRIMEGLEAGVALDDQSGMPVGLPAPLSEAPETFVLRSGEFFSGTYVGGLAIEQVDGRVDVSIDHIAMLVTDLEGRGVAVSADGVPVEGALVGIARIRSPGGHTLEIDAAHIARVYSVRAVPDLRAGEWALEQKRRLLVAKVDGLPVLRCALVEPGVFWQGAEDDDEYGEMDELPRRRVQITSTLWVSMTEVTQDSWLRVMGYNPSEFRRAAHPVESVSWYACVEYCRRLSAVLGVVVRLPTEAEWEHFARAGSDSEFYFGAGEGLLEKNAWYRWTAVGHTHPVGMLQPNRLGLFDLYGNVSEWCFDWYGDYLPGEQVDPTGPSEGRFKVRRGGSWGQVARHCRSAARAGSPPLGHHDYTGFRPVIDGRTLPVPFDGAMGGSTLEGVLPKSP